LWHIPAQSQCGSTSAAGESGLCIVIATLRQGQRIAEPEAKIDALQRHMMRADQRDGDESVTVGVYSLTRRCRVLGQNGNLVLDQSTTGFDPKADVRFAGRAVKSCCHKLRMKVRAKKTHKPSAHGFVMFRPTKSAIISRNLTAGRHRNME
jgi:hypothetical protein